MSTSKMINPWLENFMRQSMTKRGIILSGNLLDLAFSIENRPAPFNTIIEKTLKHQGFKEVVFFSRSSGVTGIDPERWAELKSNVARENNEEPTKNARESNYLDDDIFGEFETEDDRKDKEEAAMQETIEEFMETAHRIMTGKTPHKIAFVMDWSNYFFGQVNSLTDGERDLLQSLSSCFRDSNEVKDARAPRSIMIFLCPGNTALPPSLYIGNPVVCEIAVPLPAIAERRAFIEKNVNRFMLSHDSDLNRAKNLESFAVMTDGLTLKEIFALTRLSQQSDDTLTTENLVALDRYGKKESPWEKLNYERISSAVGTLQQRVKGQDKAVKAVSQILKRAYMGLSGLQHSAKARTPKGALFFVGPTGVGKTELAKSLAQFLFGDEDSCIRFDMSEFNHEHGDQRLVGAPPGYVGFEEGGQLTNAIKERPFSLVLFDEIEKAHPRILDKFLQILEDGRLTDGKGETVSFADTFIVFTSNIGASSIQMPEELTPEANKKVAEQFINAVKDHFTNQLQRPELLGRIGDANILPFNFINDPAVFRAIIKAKLKPMQNRLKTKWGIQEVEFTDEELAFSYIASKVDPSKGGRGALNALTEFLFDPLTEFLFNEVRDGEYALQGKKLVISTIGRPTPKTFDFNLE